MKIVINYDLMDKISEANKGYSLKRCTKRTTSLFATTVAISAMFDLASGSDFTKLLEACPFIFTIHSGYTAAYTYAFSGLTKEMAKSKLNALLPQLHSAFIRTDYESLLKSYKYKTEYELDSDSHFLAVEQKKYIMIPVEDEYFGNKEMSVLQEHIIGSKEYVLSLSEPEEKKVYSLGMRRMLGK